MADTESKRKSGRTPEQQAARDARKAAKKAAAEAEAAATATNGAEAADGAKAKPVYDEADMMEVDLKAGAPLSKAEARAAKKRAKMGLAPVEKKAEYEKKAKKFDKGDGDDAGDADGDDGAEGRGPRKTKEKTGGKEEKGEFSVWVGNMSFRTQPEALKAWLQAGITELGGEDDCVTRVYLPKKAGRGEFSENKGFAYCDFKTEQQQLLAIGLSERPLDGRRLLIKAGNDHKANPNARTLKTLPSGPDTARIGKQQHAESSTLFIGNLPFDVTEEELRELIEDNAADLIAEEEKAEQEEKDGEEDGEEEDDEMDEEAREAAREKKAKEELTRGTRGSARAGLIKTRVAQFEDTGRCKGFAFWDFKSPLHARAALMNKKNHFLRGIKLTLQYASQEATKRAGGKRNRDGLGSGGSARSQRPQKRERLARAPRYFEGEGGEGQQDGGYEARSAAPAHTDFKSEAAAQARIAAMVSGGGDEGDRRREPSDKRDKRGKRWESTGRPAPGAALAMAKRENVGIVESAGSKITFD